MSFLAPLFFAGLAALAIPVLVHLIQRERKNVVVFPSLMFLKRVPYESVRRRRIHNWALLMMRLAALALIISAFARPFIRGASVSAAAGGARDVVILLDRSYSMGYADQWTRAQRAATDVVNGLTAGDRASLVFFGTDAQVVVRPTNEMSRLVSEINAARPSAGATRYGPALKLAGSLLAESTLPRREVVLVSDFQRRGWTPGDGLRLPAGTTLIPTVIQAHEAVNVGVTPVTLQREIFSGQDRVMVTAGVLNRTNQAVSNLEVNLEMDGRVVQTARVSLEPFTTATTTFPPVTVSGDARGTVRIGQDALAADNAFHFMISPPRPVPVSVVNGGRASRESALYLLRALGIGEAPKFEVTVRQPEELTDQVLGATRVVVLNDAGLSETVAARVKRFVENGGGVFVVLGQQSAWPGSAAELLPATPTGTVDRTRGTAGAIGTLSYGHVVFEPFRTPRSGDFTSARFYNYRNVTPAKDAHVLARFDDGAAALIERQIGRGRVLLWSSTLDLSWTDLPLKPVFLPFVHQVTRHLAAYRERPAWSTVGQVIDLSEMDGASGRNAGAAGDFIALAPGGERAPFASERGHVLELVDQGFYEIRRQSRQGGPVFVTASNVELAEGDRTPLDPQEMVVAVTGGAGNTGPGGAPADLPDEAHERAQRLWWYLLFAGILLLTAESFVAHRISAKTA